MAFDPVERETIEGFSVGSGNRPEWRDSPLRQIVAGPPTSKGRFARTLIESLAGQVGAVVTKVPERRGSRIRVGRKVCELKFSTEDPPRFQQVRPPVGDYDYLLTIAARPERFVYWLLPAEDVVRLIDNNEIQYQHAEDSCWFFPALTGRDAFSRFRLDTAGLLAKLRLLK